MKIKLKAKILVTDENSVAIEESDLNKFTSESKWQPGHGILGGSVRPLERRMHLGEFVYRFNGQAISGSPETFLPCEYIDWRDS